MSSTDYGLSSQRYVIPKLAILLRLFYLIITFCLNAATNPLFAEVYRWQDEQGQFHYSDKATNSAASRINVNSDNSFYKVVRVFDGDTFLIEGGRRIRLIGINTPEVSHGRAPAEAGGEVAKTWLQQTLEGQSIRVETDNTVKDKYQRTLAYVFMRDGKFINQQLLLRGLAVLNLYSENLKYAEILADGQKQAEKENLGLWALAEYQAKTLAEYRLKRPQGWQRILIKPTEILETRKYYKLARPNQFEILIAKDAGELFGDLRQYLDVSLEVRGWPKKRDQKTLIEVRHPSAIISNPPHNSNLK